MSISKINSGLPMTDKISQLNDMIIELNGKVSAANFDKNEMSYLLSGLGLDRKFLREVALGNTEATYTNWSHLHAESGYSIWKYTPSNYAYNILNELYQNNKVLVNRGLATSESATLFDKVFLYDGSYTDLTTEAGTEEGTEFELMSDTTDYLYVGSDSMFHGIKLELKNKGSEYDLKVEYYNGESGVNAWVELSESAFELNDSTLSFTSDGSITWNSLIDDTWGTTTVNGVSKYWIRISTVAVPVVIAEAYYIIPDASVTGLLALSYSQIMNEEWAWCSYNGSIYVTIRNTGNSYGEGEYYITTSSSSNNKKNFFVYNNAFTMNHEDSSYTAGLPEYADNASALSNGLVVGQMYRTGDSVKIVH